MKFLVESPTEIVIALWIGGRIAVKSGYPRWYGLLWLIPFAAIWFAYTEWPIERTVDELRRETGAAPPRAIWREGF